MRLKVHELEERKSELETEKALVDDQLSILRKRVEVLDGVATQVNIFVKNCSLSGNRWSLK